MGLDIKHTTFSDGDYTRFGMKLNDELRALEALIARPGFGQGATTIGAELELAIVDEKAEPLPCNRPILAQLVDPRLTLELDRFNLEINVDPVTLAGRPMTQLAAQLEESLLATRAGAAKLDGRIVIIGILPTLAMEHLTASALTSLNRYKALSEGVKRLRAAPFHIDIAGADHLTVEHDDVTFEGANTSFQIHLKVEPEAFAPTYNAAQIMTAPVLAVSGNSPFFLGRSLWDETRIALFRQSVDDRPEAGRETRRPARVSFGHGWVRHGAFELFAEAVRQHQPLLPAIGPEDPLAVVAAGGTPELAELKLHHGTVWRWNRAVYDHHGGGHLRIEFRALPAGPTVADMVANAALMLGLTLAARDVIEEYLYGLTFSQARQNFYEAAQHGLDAKLCWPTREAPSPRLVAARDLVMELLPLAMKGLVDHGVEPSEAEHYLGLIAKRVERRVTGASWQRAALNRLERRSSRAEAMRTLVETYHALSLEGRPVHEWPDEVG